MHTHTHTRSKAAPSIDLHGGRFDWYSRGSIVLTQVMVDACAAVAAVSLKAPLVQRVTFILKILGTQCWRWAEHHDSVGADSKPLFVVFQEVLKPKMTRGTPVCNGWLTPIPRNLTKLASATRSHVTGKQKSNTTLLKLFSTLAFKRIRKSTCAVSDYQ